MKSGKPMADNPEGRTSREKKRVRVRLIAIGSSFFIGALLMAVKFYAYYLTGSSAILSDALESIINVVASAFAAVSIILAAMPPDDTHPYGHGKIEFFSAGFEGALIILAAFGIFSAGISHLLEPRVMPNLDSGLLLLLSTAAINLVLGLSLVTVGRRTDSLALIADGEHVLTDVYTSGGVLAGLFLVRLTGWLWLDGTVACLVGLNILFTGARLIRHAFAGLMDASDPVLLDEVSRLLLENRKKYWIDIHQLRAWKAGNLVHIDLHIVLPRDYVLDEAHHEAKEIETLLIRHFDGYASVLIHMDPCLDPDCAVCRRFKCDMRTAPGKETVDWNRESMTVRRQDPE